MLIPCPICGPRDHSEFTYGGDATLTRPPLGEDDADVWAHFVYDRENPRGPHREYWHHNHGCRHWLAVWRDTATHHVAGADLVGPWAGWRAGGEDA